MHRPRPRLRRTLPCFHTSARPAPAAPPRTPSRPRGRSQPRRWAQEESELPHPNSTVHSSLGGSRHCGYLPGLQLQEQQARTGRPPSDPVHEPRQEPRPGQAGTALVQPVLSPLDSSLPPIPGAGPLGSAMAGAAAARMWVCAAVLAALLPVLAAAEHAAGRNYRAVFNFGDSLVDAGNLVTEGIPDYLATARLPYGQTFFGYPTGRCSDGRLVVDFIAQELGLPFLPPSKAKNASFAQGANFAITGATALDTDFFQKRGLGKTVWNSGSLFTQIQWLRDLKPSLCSSAQECKEFFAECLFIVGEFGGNDYNAPLFAGKDLKEAYKLMPHVIQGISDGVEQLIAEGAKDLIVPGVMPSGCFPVYLTMYSDPKEAHGSRTGCLKRFNTFSWVHNAMLKRTLEKLRAKHPGVRIMYGDYFTPVIQFILQPEKFGFYKQLPKACCGAPGRGPYNFNLTAKCGEPGASACADPKTHWSWDGIHLTEAAYGHIARGWLHGPFGDEPIVQSS